MNKTNVIYRSFSAVFVRSLGRAGIVIMMLGMVSSVPIASAAESASFRLYDSFPNVSNPAPDASDSFLMNENGVTWVAQPVVSTSFQIVTAPPSFSSSSLSSSAGSMEAISSSARPQPGGRRPRAAPSPLHPAPVGPSSASSSSSTSAGVMPFDDGLPDEEEGDLGYEDEGQRMPFDGFHAADDTGVRPPFDGLWRYGGSVRFEALHMTWSWLGIVNASLEVLLVLLALRFFLFYRKRSR